MQNYITCSRKNRVYNDIGNSSAVNTHIRNQRKIDNERHSCFYRQKQVYIFFFPYYNENNIDKIYSYADHKSNGFKSKITVDCCYIDFIRIHCLNQDNAVKKYTYRKQSINEKRYQSRFKSIPCKVFFVIAQYLVQNRIQRHNQKRPQRFIDQIKPFHLADHIKSRLLAARRNKKRLNRLVNCRNKSQRTQCRK